VRGHKRSRSIGGLAVLFAIGVSGALTQSGTSKSCELRIYTANAGKLADFQTLFRSQALPLLAKYGIDNVFHGSVLEGAGINGPDAPNMQFCMVAHQNRGGRGESLGFD
jgi:hypothetical protein